ncbi:MAG: nickel/cobalt transporter, partial [Vulcanimicrobiaceae bacterium]
SWNARDLPSWADDENALSRSGLHVSVDGKPVSLTSEGARARLRPGAGGLPILYWVGEFGAQLDATRAHHVALDDRVYADRRIGWKDVVAGSQTEPTHELQRYPNALLGSPRRISAATFTVSPSGTISAISNTLDTQPAAGTLSAWIAPTVLSDMFSRPKQTPLFVVFTMLAAFGLGALHAIEPGHGKALLAFTLVGARATVKQAVTLALSLTFAHTAGVLLLGLALFFAVGFVSESIYPWITLASGIVVALIGARSLARFVRNSRRLSHSHEHEHHGAHSHTHSHGHDRTHDHAASHGHSHTIPGSQPLNFSSAIWAAMSGGIAPCPAAIVVLLAALRLHQIGYGTVLIVIFSAGLATVLSAIGIGVVHGAAWLSRRSAYARVVPVGPLLSACVISAICAWMAGQGLSEQGIPGSALLLAALMLAAIAGYALAQHGHAHSHPHGEARAT